MASGTGAASTSASNILVLVDDFPVVGDWSGTGEVRIGVFRPSTGEWFLDKNGKERLMAVQSTLVQVHSVSREIAGWWKSGDNKIPSSEV